MGLEASGNGTATSTGRPSGPRYIFQLDSNTERTVLRVLDTANDTIFREIPIEEFLAYARQHRNVKPFLLGQLP